MYSGPSQIDNFRLASCLFFICCFVVSLLGCEENSTHTVVESSSLANLENEKLAKLSEIAKEKWDVVCVLTPYSGGVGDDHGDSRIKTIQQKKHKLNLTISESDWYMLFEKSGTVIADSFRTKEIHIYQKNLGAIRKRKLDKLLFKPKSCMEFSQATIYKFNINGRNYISLGEVKE